MVASINFKPMIASNIPKLSKGIKIGGGVIGAVGIIGLAAYYVLKDAGWDHLDKDDNKESMKNLINRHMGDNKLQSALAPSLLNTEGIRTTIYNDKKPKINYKISKLFNMDGNYTVGVGHMLSSQKGDLQEVLAHDLREAQKITGLNNVSVEIIDGELTPEQMSMLLKADLIRHEKTAKGWVENDLDKFDEKSKVKWDELPLAKKVALVSLSFNTKQSSVKYNNGKPTNFLKHVRAGNWAEAQKEMDFWRGYPINTIAKRYLEMRLINDDKLDDDIKDILFQAVNKSGHHFKSKEEAIAFLEEKCAEDIAHFKNIGLLK